MGLASYKVVRQRDDWAVDHDGKVATEAAAFEAVVGPPSDAINLGHAVHIVVSEREGNRPALGTS